MKSKCHVPPIGPAEREEIGESEFVCSIKGLYGSKKITVNAINKDDAIQQCIHTTGKRPSGVYPLAGGAQETEPSPMRQYSGMYQAKGDYEPHALGPLTMKR